MFGLRFIKVQPTDFIMQYQRGQRVRQGVGLSFFYFAPTSSLVRIPLASTDAPFIFEGVTADFQTVTIQGMLTYRISDAEKLSQLMNFTLTGKGQGYASDDPEKLPQRLINQVEVLARSSLLKMELRDALGSIDDLGTALREAFEGDPLVDSLGIEILNLSIVAIKPTPETARALEAEAREQILREADEAVYARRNAAVAQERNIKENELNTEIAVEKKKRQIRETQMEAEKSVQQMNRELEEARMETSIALEEMNRQLTALSAENVREEAEAKAYAVSAVMQAMADTDPRILQALASSGMDAGQLIALAFKEIAESADQIGQLNISPELLRALLPARDGT